MRKLLMFLLVACSFMAMSLFSQTSEPVPITVDIRGDVRDGTSLMAWLDDGRFERRVSPDSLATGVSRLASADSTDALYGGSSLLWTVKVDSINLTDSLSYWSMATTDLDKNTVIRRDTVTIPYGATGLTAIDPGAYSGAARIANSMFVANPMGWSFTLCTWARLRGWGVQRVKQKSFQMQYIKRSYLEANYVKALATFAKPGKLDSLTLLVLDTLQTTVDTFYTSPAPGNYGYVTLFIDKIPITGTASHFGLGYQVKYDGGGWYGDLTTNGLIIVLDDSIYMAAADTARAARVSMIPADSVRFALYDKSALRTIFKRIKALWRD